MSRPSKLNEKSPGAVGPFAELHLAELTKKPDDALVFTGDNGGPSGDALLQAMSRELLA